ncbi:SusC/RagA family TonB-linked outer membrane protein [Dyadobacter sp. 676]|uniref:SusC/RagA family TonB-linked outer membrane protein n=1 Tax=Dyadobacter sp. 676 TaxID=3088362 RepID=A0AAU8FSH1_9BACT
MFQNLSRNALLSRGLLIAALLLPGLGAFAQNIAVKGTVTSATDNGSVPGVNIVVKNTLTGTSTDADGKYEINAPSNGILVFSGIGYVTQEVAVNGRATIDIKLAADTKQLEEVVVVGYGTQKRNALTNSVSQISGEAITKRPVSNIQQSMQGLMPGVTVLDQGGSPGKSNTNIRVRGITTFNINGSSTSGYDLGKNDALVIVDGIEQRLSDINPDDIESISVLKDASSTAIYGSRATNGVILVTTKRAKGGKVQVDYHGYYAVQKSNNVPKMMGIEAYMREQVAAYTNAGLAVPARFTEESIQAYVHATDREKYPMPNTWFETMLRSAPQQNHTISVAGGTDMIRTRLSARFQDQQGVIAGYSNKIGEFRLNTDYNVSKRIRVSGDINYRYARALNPTVNNSGQNPQPLNHFFHGTLWAVPKYPDGTYGLSTQGNNPLMFNEIGGAVKTSDGLPGGLCQG